MDILAKITEELIYSLLSFSLPPLFPFSFPQSLRVSGSAEAMTHGVYSLLHGAWQHRNFSIMVTVIAWVPHGRLFRGGSA